MRTTCCLVLAAGLCCLLVQSAGARESSQQAEISAMGGIPINITAWGIDRESFTTAVQQIELRIAELEGMMSTYQPESAVSQLNAGAEVDPLPAELQEVLRAAVAISAETDGAFDITVKPLVELWRRCVSESRLPTDTELAAELARVGYGNLQFEEAGCSFSCKNVMLDLGGIAKGYFADQAVEILKAAGIERCLVDCGGDITAWQPLEGREMFHVGVRDPLGGKNLLAVLEIEHGAVVTSGNYERYYEIEGRRYCHIFDPRTGLPVEQMLSVTLLAPDGMTADALATAVFVMGQADGASFVEEHEQIEAVIISSSPTDGMQVYISSGLTERIEFAVEN